MTDSVAKINEKIFPCVICPSTCRLQVWTDPETKEIIVKGNKCPRGLDYGANEYTHPVRMLITTMRIKGGKLPVIPVRSDKEIPKEQIFDAIRIVNEAHCHAPITMGDVLIKNILNLGINVIASRNMDAITKRTDVFDKEDNLDTIEILRHIIRSEIPHSSIQDVDAVCKKIINQFKI